MENLPDINQQVVPIVNDAFFQHWNPIINGVFQYLYNNNLEHLDTKSQNVYFTGTLQDPKLAIIDFGEAEMPETEQTLLRLAKRDGYYKHMTTLQEFKDWITNPRSGFGGTYISGNTDYSDFWGGGKKRKNKTQKPKKRNKTTKKNKGKATKRTK
jgi:hypothetical protein